MDLEIYINKETEKETEKKKTILFKWREKM